MALEKILKNSSGVPTGEYERIAGGTLYADSPIGSIQPYGGADAPAGWMICDGTSLLRASYPELFAVIGTAFGSADSTHFNIPDMTGKTTMGVETGHALGASENGALPNIKGDVYNGKPSDMFLGFQYPNGAFSVDGEQNTATVGSLSTSKTNARLNLNASRSSSIYTDGQTKVDPANVRVNYIIKAKMIAVPADFLAKVDETINENATSPVSASNKLVTESNISTKVGVITGSGITYRTFTCTLSDATKGYQNHEFLLVTREENVLINARIHSDGTLNVTACNINGEANTITNIGYAFDNTTRTLTIGVTLASWAMTLSVVKITYPKDVASTPIAVSTLPTLTDVTIKKLVTESDLNPVAITTPTPVSGVTGGDDLIYGFKSGKMVTIVLNGIIMANNITQNQSIFTNVPTAVGNKNIYFTVLDYENGKLAVMSIIGDSLAAAFQSDDKSAVHAGRYWGTVTYMTSD